jgi:spermidine synthase
MNRTFMFIKILLTGAIILALELAASRVMTPFFGVSLYVWSAVLGVTLTALAAGYKYGGMLAARLPRERLLLFYAAAGGLAALWVVITAWTYPFLFVPLASFDLVAGSIVACIFLLLVPLIVLSALNPLLVALLHDDTVGDYGAGNVFFVSTVGSVLGIFFTAYALMPFLTNYSIILLMAMALSALSLLALFMIRNTCTGRLYKAAVTVTLLALAVAGGTLATGGLQRLTGSFSHDGQTWRITHAAPSYFGNVQVLDIYNSGDKHLSRALLNDGLMQNQFFASGAAASLFTYALERTALAAVESPQSALVLGVAAGVLPMNLAARGISVQAVDINTRIIDISRDHLGLQTDMMNLRIEDARMSVRHCAPTHDIVAVDLFRDDGIPEHLVTREFFGNIHHCLKDNGVMVMNSFMNVDHPQSQYALLKTIAGVFGEVTFYQRKPSQGTDFTAGYIIARRGAPVGAIDVSYDGMPKSMAQGLREALATARTFRADDPIFAYVPILTDLGNRWKHLSLPAEIAYRKTTIQRIPWQVLLN